MLNVLDPVDLTQYNNLISECLAMQTDPTAMPYTTFETKLIKVSSKGYFMLLRELLDYVMGDRCTHAMLKDLLLLWLDSATHAAASTTFKAVYVSKLPSRVRDNVLARGSSISLAEAVDLAAPQMKNVEQPAQHSQFSLVNDHLGAPVAAIRIPNRHGSVSPRGQGHGSTPKTIGSPNRGLHPRAAANFSFVNDCFLCMYHAKYGKDAYRCSNSSICQWPGPPPVAASGPAPINCMDPSDLGYSPAELVYDAPLNLPNAYFQRPTTSTFANVDVFVDELRPSVGGHVFTPAAWHRGSAQGTTTGGPPRLLKGMDVATHVWERVDLVRRPLECPYRGLYRVVSWNDKFFVVLKNGAQASISMERLKPAFGPLAILDPPSFHHR
ncbi:hypothetical protein TCAL_17088 [Tigriopus californicus]|uniref:Uncharacterized protein n=1 Tax=Tigriopus californicus TaxID=6832 RepID=A0A553PP92_TIGCA|nr:hypothetical protein TCAL_17088 [Tigriopus californicus]